MRTPSAARFAALLVALAGCSTPPSPPPPETAQATQPTEAAPPAQPVQTNEPAKIELKLTAGPGDVFHFRQVQHIVQGVKVMEMDVDTTIDVTQTMTFTVGPARADGLTDVNVTIGDVKGSFESSLLGTFEVDSSKDDEPAADDETGIATAMKQLTLLANKSYRVVFDARGRLVEIHGLREIIDEALKRNPAFAGKGIGALIDDASMKRQMQAQFAMFSDGPVAVGGKWTVESSMASPVAMKVATEYTLVSADDAKAVVTSKSDVVPAANGADAKPSSTVEGTVTVSRADGLLLRSESRTHVAADVPGDPKAGPDARKMHIDMTTTITTDRVAAEDSRPAAKKGPPPAPAPAAPPATPPAPK